MEVEKELEIWSKGGLSEGTWIELMAVFTQIKVAHEREQIEMREL